VRAFSAFGGWFTDSSSAGLAGAGTAVGWAFAVVMANAGGWTATLACTWLAWAVLIAGGWTSLATAEGRTSVGTLGGALVDV